MASRADRPVSEADGRIQAVRHFNRFYTRRLGLLRGEVLESPCSLGEARVLFEIAHHDGTTATALCTELGLDAGYMSRMLRGFERRGWLSRRTFRADARRSAVTLTARGRAAFAPLEKRSSEQVRQILAAVPPGAQHELVGAMRAIERMLSAKQGLEEPYLLRSHQPGDVDWVVHRHGVLYADEYRYDERFEALVAQVVADFVTRFDPAHERCWIAERYGERVGSVFLVRKSAKVAKLRLLLVEPSARGLGIGKRLVHECVRFARRAGYERILLWTQSELEAARGIYREAGFRIVDEERHDSWGRTGLVAETWELKLERGPARRER